MLSCTTTSGPSARPNFSLACPTTFSAHSTTGLAVPVAFPAPITTTGQHVTVVCSPASGAAFPVGTSSVTCTASGTEPPAATCTFPVTVTGPPRLTVTRFVGFGDSITWGEDGTNAGAAGIVGPQWRSPAIQVPLAQTYEGVLQAQLGARYTAQVPVVGNAGSPGETLLGSDTLTRFSNVLASTSSSAAHAGPYQAVLIMEGTNDLAQKDAAIEPAMMAVLEEMITRARSQGLRPYLATIPPMNPSGSRAATEYGWYLVKDVNDRIRALATRVGVPLVDVYAALSTDVPSLIGADGVHPTVAGYAAIASTFFGVVQTTLEQPPASVNAVAVDR